MQTAPIIENLDLELFRRHAAITDPKGTEGYTKAFAELIHWYADQLEALRNSNQEQSS